MIALKNTTNNQIFYIIHKKMYGGDAGWDLKPLVVEYTENGQYSVNPPSGYDGFSSVNVTVDVDCQECNLTTSTVTLTGDGEHTITPPEGYDGFSEVVVNVESDCDDAYNDGVADQKAKLASATFTENGSYNREDGWNTVQVNVDTVTPYNEGVEDGKDAQKALMTSLTAVSNGTYTREDGYNEVVVNVPSDVNNQNKQVTYTQNGTQTVIADNGYSGLGQVQVSVNVDTTIPYNNGKQDGINEQKAKMISGTFTQNGTFNREDGYNQVIVNVPSDIHNQNKTVTPSTSQQIITPNQGYSGLGQVTVKAVTASIDPDIKPENIKKDVVVLGVTGTYDPQPNLESKTVSYSNNGTYSINPTAGKDGLSNVQVTIDVDTQTPYNNGYADGEADQKAKLTTLTVTQNGTYTRADGYDEVIVNVQCGAVDELVLSQESITMDYSGDFPVGGVSYQIGVYSTDNWTITSMPDWVSVDVNSGLAGVSMFNLTVNSILDGRTGTVTITNGNVTKTITIVQNDLETRYLTFEVTSPGTLYWKQYGIAYSRAIQYSTTGTNWTSITSVTTNNGCLIGNFSVGTKIMFKANTPTHPINSDNYYYFVFTNGLQVNVSGNLGSLNGGYYSIFKNCTGILSAENLVVPEGISSSGLFSGCTRLTTAPKSLPRGWYKSMFYGCTSLVNAPELPSTTLDNECYLSMFYGCTSLTTAPVLPAETLVSRCYQAMFQGCTSLNYVKAMFTTTPGSSYTSSWLSNVSSTGTFVKNSAATWDVSGSSGIPSGWTVQTASA